MARPRSSCSASSCLASGWLCTKLHSKWVSAGSGEGCLRLLATESPVESITRRGTLVKQIDPDHIRASYEVREALEANACELLTGKMDAECRPNPAPDEGRLNDPGCK